MASSKVFEVVRAVLGAVIGGVIGFYVYRWLLNQGYFALAIPGAFLGAGCGTLAGTQSTSRGVACALASLGLGVYAFWRNMAQPTSLQYLVTHLHETGPATLILLGLGLLLGYWFGRDPLVFSFWKRGKPRPPREIVGPLTTPPAATTMEK